MTTYTNSTQGAITLSGSTELTSASLNVGKAGGSTITMNDTDIRLLAGQTGSGNPISMANMYAKPVVSQQDYATAGTFTFFPPAGVTKISGVIIGGGAGGGGANSTTAGGGGGGGGALAYFSNTQVTPSPLNTVGVSIRVAASVAGGQDAVGANGDTSSVSMTLGGWSVTCQAATGGARGAGGGAGGTLSFSGTGANPDGTTFTVSGLAGLAGAASNGSGGGGGGGAGGYTASGATATTNTGGGGGGGGGVGIFGGGTGGGGGQAATGGTAGSGGTNGSNGGANVAGAGGNFGGGGGGGDDVAGASGRGGNGAQGYVRIIWGNFATTRFYPSTGTLTNL
jgi:hypothetical protein